MPREGTKSLYVRELLFTQLKQKYEEQKEELASKGITTFNGWVAKLLADSLEEYD